MAVLFRPPMPFCHPAPHPCMSPCPPPRPPPQETETLKKESGENGIMASVDPGNPRHFHVTIQGPGEVRAREGRVLS